MLFKGQHGIKYFSQYQRISRNIMFKSVLIVCIGNICRSPVAEGLLKHYSEKYNLDLDVASAGVHALVGDNPQPHSQEMAVAHNLDISDYYAEQITQEMVSHYELIIALDEFIRKDLLHRYPFAAGKIKKLGFLNNNMDIDDPYKKDKTAFVQMYADIDLCLQTWVEKVWQAPMVSQA